MAEHVAEALQLLQTFQFGEDEQDMSEAMQDAVSFMVEKQGAIVSWRQTQVRGSKRCGEHPTISIRTSNSTRARMEHPRT